MIQFERDEIRLDHEQCVGEHLAHLQGPAGCVIVTPVNPEWTQYDVTDTDGKVTVAAARKT